MTDASGFHRPDYGLTAAALEKQREQVARMRAARSLTTQPAQEQKEIAK